MMQNANSAAKFYYFTTARFYFGSWAAFAYKNCIGL